MMLTETPCRPSSPASPSDRASLRVPCVSNFGINQVTLFLRKDGSLGSSAGDITSHRRSGRARVCTIKSDYAGVPDAIFVVLESNALLRLISPSANQ
jgi:hypothetical protein